jgi:transcriptional regulator with XRE-family HTH domain
MRFIEEMNGWPVPNLFIGDDVRSLRKRHKLSRKELAEFLGVSAVTIEKWEQAKEKIIRPKYEEKLTKLSKLGAAGVFAGLLAAPALVLPAALLGGGSLLGKLVTDEELENAASVIEGLKKLTPEEREQFFTLSKKIASNVDNKED